jgi:hypothetical protein
MLKIFLDYSPEESRLIWNLIVQYEAIRTIMVLPSKKLPVFFFQ